MRYVLILLLNLLFFTPLYALEFSKKRNVEKSIHSVSIDLKSYSLKKETNYFDEKELTLGTYKISEEKIKDYKFVLEDAHEKLLAIDEIYKQQGSSFNKVHGELSPEQSYFKLGDFIINNKQGIYQEMDSLFVKIMALNHEPLKIVKFNLNNEMVDYYENKTLVQSERLVKQISCRDIQLPTRCYIKDFGYLLIEKSQ